VLVCVVIYAILQGCFVVLMAVLQLPSYFKMKAFFITHDANNKGIIPLIQAQVVSWNHSPPHPLLKVRTLKPLIVLLSNLMQETPPKKVQKIYDATQKWQDTWVWSKLIVRCTNIYILSQSHLFLMLFTSLVSPYTWTQSGDIYGFKYMVV
jgi:hypothetical protein